MAWKVILGEGASELQLTANVRFDLDLAKNVNDDGTVESVDWRIEVEGVVVDPVPGTVASTYVTYANQVVDEFDAVRVRLQQDGTDRWDLKPEQGFNGPHVVGFRSLGKEEGGTAESHWRYAFTVLYKSTAIQTEGEENVFELHTSLAVTKKNGKVVRKVWKASAKSTSVESAHSAVLTFKPSEKFVTEEVERFFQESRATALWVWEEEKAGVLAWTCDVRYTGGRIGFVGAPRAGAGADAALFLKQRGPLRVDVRGRIVSFDPDVAEPPEHFSESPTMFRATELEDTQVGATILDDLRGEYVLTYHEVWLSVGPTGEPNHAQNHHLIEVGKAPGDGGMAN